MLQKDRYLYKGYRGFQSLQLPGSKTVSKTKIHTSKANIGYPAIGKPTLESTIKLYSLIHCIKL